VIYLDTHVVLWLYGGSVKLLSPHAKSLIEKEDLCVSPLVELELHYLSEIGRLVVAPSVILESLSEEIGLQVRSCDLTGLVRAAILETWTRDPFDRMIVAQSKLERCLLLTRDRTIRKHAPNARW
jgi:PIN domain nuclease of toxin-antitoxin system